jgi:hypothetical protein
MIRFKTYNDVSKSLEYHATNGLALGELYRLGSKAYYETFNEARKLHAKGLIELTDVDKFFIEETDIGEFALYEGMHIPLDCPMEAVNEEKDVELNSPKRGGNKKYYVYVKNDKGNIIKVEFGDTSGLTAKINDPEARKSFVARHQCELKKDKTKAGYWACRLPYYAKQLGLSGGGKFFW